MADTKKIDKAISKSITDTICCSNIPCRDGPKEGGKFKVCSGCKIASYCSRECQVSHWKVHKGTCTSFSSDPNAPSRKEAKQLRDAAALISIEMEPQIFSAVRAILKQTKPRSSQKILDSALQSFIDKNMVEIEVQHVDVDVKNTRDFVKAVVLSQHQFTFTKIESFHKNIQAELSVIPKGKGFLSVMIRYRTEAIGMTIYEGILKEKGSIFDKPM